MENAWIIERHIEEGQYPGSMYETIWEVEPGVWLSYVEEPVSGNCFVVFSGEPGELMDESFDIANRELKAYSIGELLKGVDRARRPRDLARAVIRAGIGAPVEYDERFFSRIVDAAGNREEKVRHVALMATMFTEWDEFLPVVQQIGSGDPVNAVRARAADVVKAFYKAEEGKS